MSDRPTRDRGTYGQDELCDAFRKVGIVEGDTVFSHVGPGLLGRPRQGGDEQSAWSMITGALRSVIGASGTWVVPTYSHTFTKPGETFDPALTPSEVGPFTEHFRRLPHAVRSLDPLFSVAAIGPASAQLTGVLPHDCFGKDSVYERLTTMGAKLCNIGVGFRYATHVHHVEQTVGVPYRFPKYFTGRVRVGDRECEETWLYYVRDLEDPAGRPDLRRLEAEARSTGLLRSADVGLGRVTGIALDDLESLCSEQIRRDPWFLARGGSREYEGALVEQFGRVEHT